jgi:hypothetical protein
MTNPTNSGETDSLLPTSAEQRLIELDEILDQYEHVVGLPACIANEVEVEGTRIYNLSPAVLKKFTAVECGEAAFVLRQFASHIQRSANREQARVTWAEESIKKIIAKTVNQYKGVSFEERKLQAVRDNDAASKLDAIRVRAKLRLERLAYMSSKIGDQAKSLESLQYAKRGERD